METRSRKRKDHPTHSTAAYSKAPKVGRKAEVAEPVEPHKRACHQGRASSKRDARAGVASPRASGHSSKEARQAGQRGKDKKQDAQPAKMDSSSRRLRSENEDEMMEDDHVRWEGVPLQQGARNHITADTCTTDCTCRTTLRRSCSGAPAGALQGVCCMVLCCIIITHICCFDQCAARAPAQARCWAGRRLPRGHHGRRPLQGVFVDRWCSIDRLLH